MIGGRNGCVWTRGAVAVAGEAMGDVDFKDLKTVPVKVAETVAMAASSGAHLVGLLKGRCIRGWWG